VAGHYRYLLDTNILSDLLRNPQGVVAQRIATVGEESICTSIIVAAELRFGVTKSGSLRLAERVHILLSAIAVMALESPSDQHYATLRQHLNQSGTPIGPNDMLIAAQALAMGLIVITANVREFRRVPGLAVENWLQG